MAHHDHDDHGASAEFVEKFTIQPGLRKFILGLIGAGAVMLVLGIAINIWRGEPQVGHEQPATPYGPIQYPKVKKPAPGHGAEAAPAAHAEATPAAPAEHETAESAQPQDQSAAPQASKSGDTHAQPEGSASNAQTGSAEYIPTPMDEAQAAPPAGHQDAQGQAHEGEAVATPESPRTPSEQAPHGVSATEPQAAGAEHGSHGAEGHAAEGHHGPTLTGPYWLNRLLVSINQEAFFFMGIGIIMAFWIALNFTANAGWSVLLKRVPEAFTQFAPVGWGILFFIYILEKAGVVHIHLWTDSSLTDPNNPNRDELLMSKTWYLNDVFFVLRQVITIAGWFFAIYMFRKLSLKQDELRTTKVFWDQRKLAGGFLVFFAFTFAMSGFDWIMALDPHWFSTMFGVHMFATCWVSALCMLALVTMYLKKAGFMPQVNDAHLHDLGKFIFGFSIFWTYIWFSQFMLIWYANIPEETAYFLRMLDNYPFLFALNLVINFIFPFLSLMTNTSKRRTESLGFVAAVLLFGHFIDLYLVSAPPVLGAGGGIGFIELGTFFTFLGLFLWLGFSRLAKVPLVNTGHPYLEESVHHYY